MFQQEVTSYNSCWHHIYYRYLEVDLLFGNIVISPRSILEQGTINSNKLLPKYVFLTIIHLHSFPLIFIYVGNVLKIKINNTVDIFLGSVQ